jgi:hypothetical protein
VDDVPVSAYAGGQLVAELAALEDYEGYDVDAMLAAAVALERDADDVVLRLRARLVQADMHQRKGDVAAAALTCARSSDFRSSIRTPSPRASRPAAMSTRPPRSWAASSRRTPESVTALVSEASPGTGLGRAGTAAQRRTSVRAAERPARAARNTR